MEFPVAPVNGRFHLLRGPIPESPGVHVRLVESTRLEVLVGATAYTGLLDETNAFCYGLDCIPPVGLVATLLSIPRTNARVMKRDPGGDVRLSCLGTTHRLEISAWDRLDVQLELNVGLALADASPIVTDLVGGLLCAVGGLESVLRSVEAERIGGGSRSAASAESGFKAMHKPTMVKGKPIEQHPAWKKYVVRDVAEIGNRAYVVADDAVRVGKEIRRGLEEKKDRERKAQQAKRERRKTILKAKQEAAKAKENGGNGRTKRKTADFFDGDSEDEEENVNANGNGASSEIKKDGDAEKGGKSDEIAVKKETKEEIPNAPMPTIEKENKDTEMTEKAAPSVETTQKAKQEEETKNTQGSQTAQKASQDPGNSKAKPKKKKKRRKLV